MKCEMGADRALRISEARPLKLRARLEGKKPKASLKMSGGKIARQPQMPKRE